ncbi:MAG TPA: chemotaxis protein CheD [Blastocatellia bacterium]|nr:chemotaxis protein CheD [Blastocatellia bacterium]
MNEAERITSPGCAPVELAKHYLHPGQVFATSEPYAVTTILGSCVAVCLWDARSQVAGINHYMLPLWSRSGHSSPRFGNVAMGQLIRKTLALGAEKECLRAKLFGGACVLAALGSVNSDLGAKNIELARQILNQEGIPVVAEDSGGDFGRKLIFNTVSGSVMVKKIAQVSGWK